MTVWTTATSYLFLVTSGAHAAASAVEGEGWRADLPWAELKAKLSPSASLIDTGFEVYAAECVPEFVNFEYVGQGASVDSWSERSTFALIDQVCICLSTINRLPPPSFSSYSKSFSRNITTTAVWSLLTPPVMCI